MNLEALSDTELARRLRRGEFALGTGPFVLRIHSSIPRVARGIRNFYGDYPVFPPDEFADFHVRIASPNPLRRWVRPQVQFYFDGRQPFTPLPLAHSFALLEWGMNWCISAHSNRYLIIHAAVVAKDDRAVILPAPPGSGKSTLCAGLVSRGWRLLSDELTLVATDRTGIVPVPRPISLKNASIQVMGRFAPDAEIGFLTHDTHKGTVGHMKVPLASVRGASVPAAPRWVVFPKYLADAPARLEPRSQGQAFMKLVENAFNYSILGREGFDLLGDVIDQCACFDFSYGDLEEAVRIFDELADPAPSRHP